jgi:hypothetical protein
MARNRYTPLGPPFIGQQPIRSSRYPLPQPVQPLVQVKPLLGEPTIQEDYTPSPPPKANFLVVSTAVAATAGLLWGVTQKPNTIPPLPPPVAVVTPAPIPTQAVIEPFCTAALHSPTTVLRNVPIPQETLDRFPSDQYAKRHQATALTVKIYDMGTIRCAPTRVQAQVKAIQEQVRSDSGNGGPKVPVVLDVTAAAQQGLTPEQLAVDCLNAVPNVAPPNNPLNFAKTWGNMFGKGVGVLTFQSILAPQVDTISLLRFTDSNGQALAASTCVASGDGGIPMGKGQ